jgi:predicted P-loop ATPase
MNWRDRRVTIVFDTNLKTNELVKAARQMLARELTSRGANIFFFEWPEDTQASINGVDDLIGLLGRDAVRAILDSNTKPATGEQHRPLSARWDAYSLDRNGDGKPLPNLNNAVRVLENDPEWQGRIWYDTFLNRMLTRDPDGTVREWTDTDDIGLTLYMQRVIGIVKMSTRLGAAPAANAVAMRNKRNCAREYINGLHWDGESRIDYFFEDYYGAPGTAYVRRASSNFLISIVARIRQPGCKVDNMVVLEGAQGIGKSKSLEALGGPWYCEQHESATNPKAFAEILQGKVIVEISELDAFSRAEENRVKQVITALQDRYRTPYGKYAEDHPRQCVMVGTTNRDDWARDETGGRRFWPIECRGPIDVAAIKVNRDQLFAEAAHRHQQGATWWEMPEVETLAEQGKRRNTDEWEHLIADFVQTKSQVTTAEVLSECFKIEAGKFTRQDQLRVGVCLRALGWKKRDQRTKHGVVKVWFPELPPVAHGGA